MTAPAEVFHERCTSPAPDPNDLPWSSDLEGGSFTWSSGVQMTTSVEAAVPLGEEIDLCGDGSCVTSPEDVLLVVRYQVDVPAGAPAAVEPGACPGWFSMANSTDVNDVITVDAEATQPLAEPVAPGTTGVGYATVVVAAERADLWGLGLDSLCGDLDGTAGEVESAYFSADGVPVATPTD